MKKLPRKIFTVEDGLDLAEQKKLVLTFNAKEDQPRESHLWMA